ncbi:prepilin-type N-terminal cleavage/methylation domain-containing protein [Paucibacter sp. APW11]|uniref:Prepilin-type N-terminal cleavage/methylation domain-containing protein n=1 Tax=Roseateles aquae TaxID=3077235 RepID=A0ABU3P9F6_9BURK|nr:prepilin-type N-terminal cleavage/methylation domain-containing protein [Paucibacter sp. APW11]MDT8998723.1 prepilin-type N-terminal cleavage/methylation domain-containing protein [Paucibacter sp. APW11]
MLASVQPTAPALRGARRRQAGLSLVEMMVGITVGLVVTAAAASMMLSQMTETRRLLQETELQQDLRAITELIRRETQHAGYWANPDAGTWMINDSGNRIRNPYGQISLSTSPGATTPDSITFYRSEAERLLNGPSTSPGSGFKHENNSADAGEQHGFRLVNSVLSYRLTRTSQWQPLTSTDQVEITSFSITQSNQCLPTNEFSPTPCPSGSTTCTPPPGQDVMTLNFSIGARLAKDHSVTRTATTSVRVLNAGNC